MDYMNLRNPTVDDVMLVAKFDNMLARKNAEIEKQKDEIKKQKDEIKKLEDKLEQLNNLAL